MHFAAKKNRTSIIALLISVGVYIDAEDSGLRTPLHVAATYDHVDTIKLLLKEFANPTKKNAEGKTAKELTKNIYTNYLISRVEQLYSIYSSLSPKLMLERVDQAIKYIFAEYDKSLSITIKA